MSTWKPMRETELRESFEKGSQPAIEVEHIFQLARQNYRRSQRLRQPAKPIGAATG